MANGAVVASHACCPLSALRLLACTAMVDAMVASVDAATVSRRTMMMARERSTTPNSKLSSNGAMIANSTPARPRRARHRLNIRRRR